MTFDPSLDAAPLVCRLATSPGAGWLGLAELDAVPARPGTLLLFLHGDPVRFPEVLDVAVVLPELQRHAARHLGLTLTIGVVPRADEDAVAARWGVQRWPSIVMLRDGRWVATLSGMQDWSVAVDWLAQAAQRPASRPPIALHAPTASAGCH